MPVRRMLVVLAAVGMLTVVPAKAALARDSEFGTLSCPAGRVVWITERTSAGTTTGQMDHKVTGASSGA